MTRTVPFLRGLGVLLPVIGCRSPARISGNEPAIVDSAGVRIVQHAGDLNDLPRWSFDTAPLVTLGGDSAGPSNFSYPGAMLPLANGSVVIVVWGRSPEVRLFDEKGRFVKVLARRGQGPGEVICPDAYFTHPDTLVLHDYCQRRAVLVNRDGEVTATVSVPGSSAASEVTIDGATERLLSPSELIAATRLPSFCTEMQCRNSVAIIRLSAGQVIPDTLFFVSDLETNGRGQNLLFGARTSIALHSLGLIVGDGTKPELAVRTLSGKLVRSIRWRPLASRYTREDMAAYRAHDSARIGFTDPNAISSWQRSFGQYSVAKRAPELTGVRTAANGDIWVQRDGRHWMPEIPYVVFDSTGRALARIDIPRNRYPTVLGSGTVWAWYDDAEGTVRLSEYRIVRDQAHR